MAWDRMPTSYYRVLLGSTVLCVVVFASTVRGQTGLGPVPFWSSGPANETFSLAWGDVDGDGDLDLACGNFASSEGNTLYLNEGGVFETTPFWTSDPAGRTTSVAWGDVDGDGDLDLACGNYNQNNVLYLNEGGMLSSTPAWTSEAANATLGLAWGDVDGDGDLDLACANDNQSNTLYLNEGGVLATTPAWSSGPTSQTLSVVWGDLNGDGNLELVCANREQSNTVYASDGDILSPTPMWTSDPANSTYNLALGDVDGDGDLDLVCANFGTGQTNTLYVNEGGVLAATPSWSSDPSDFARSVALGDVDGDGDLDLACATALYQNENGVFGATPAWSSDPGNAPWSVAWGDMDGDGDLDLACGKPAQSNTIYENRGNVLASAPVWSSELANKTNSVALGDVDGDGDLDLACGSSEASLYLNEGGVLRATPTWSSSPNDLTSSVAWGDVDGDGDLDLACGNFNHSNTLYINDGGVLGSTPSWLSDLANRTQSVAWGDVDGDGDLDLVCGNENQANTVYLNEGGVLTAMPVWSSGPSNRTNSVAWGDVDGDGDLDLACGNRIQTTLYLNEGGELRTTPSWTGPDFVQSVAWGDVDGDGDLDLACGSWSLGQSNTLYLNEGGMLGATPAWTSGPISSTYSVAWGDVDGDGDLDLACGNRGEQNTLYLNERGVLAKTPAWVSDSTSATWSVTWGDVNGDGNVDLVCGNIFEADALYVLRPPASPQTTEFPSNHLPNNVPQIRFVEVANEATNLLRVSFRAADVESDHLYVTSQYQFAGEPVWRAVELASGSDRAGPFSASPGGQTGSFDWNIERFPRDRRDVVLRLLVSEVPARVSVFQQVASYRVEVGPIKPRRPRAFADVADLQFGTVTLGDSTVVGFELENRGSERLAVSGIDVGSPEMSVTPAPPFDIQAGASASVVVTLAPRSQLDAGDRVVIHSNDPLTPALNLGVEAEILPLAFSTDLGPEEILPLGEAVRAIVTPGANVALETGELFFRPAGVTSSFESIVMSPSGAVFSATIPGSRLSEHGLEYYTRMENSGVVATDPPGAPAALFFRAVERPSRLELTPQTNSGNDYLQARDITVLLTLDQGTVVERAQIFYRRGGATLVGSTSATGSVPVLTASIPDSFVTSRGVEYWAEVTTATTTLLSPVQGPSQPATIPVTVRALTEPHVRPGERYRMFSIPLDFGEGFSGTVAELIPELDPYDVGRARAFRYRSSTRGNQELSEAQGSEFHPEPGRAFWLVTRASHRVTTGSTPGFSTPTQSAVPIVLNPSDGSEPSWTQIGNPFNFAVEWAGVTHSSAVDRPIAFDSNLGDSGLYSGDDVVVLMPFEGYFISNSSTDAETLWVPALEAPTALVEMVTPLGTLPTPSTTDSATAVGWGMELAAQTDGASDEVRLGLHPDARSEHDRFDRLKPPSAPGPWVHISVPNPDWQDYPGSYRSDVRELTSDGQRWDVVLRSEAPGETVTLSGWTATAFPPHLHLSLLDLEQGVALDLRNGDTREYRVLSYGPNRPYRLKLLVGSRQFVEREEGALTAIPRVVSLDQNAPNPFNPATRIRFGLPEPDDVTLVIYDSRGAFVTALLDRERMPAGFHVRVWSGTDDSGQRVASGVYFYRLVTGRKTISKKLVMVQ